MTLTQHFLSSCHYFANVLFAFVFLFRVAFVYSFYLRLVLLAGVLHYNFLSFFSPCFFLLADFLRQNFCLILLLLTRSLWRSSSLGRRVSTLCSLLKTCRLHAKISLLLFSDIIDFVSCNKNL